MTKVTTVGLDLAKSVFQIHAVDQDGRPVVRKKLRRAQVVPFFADLAPCLVGMEACASAHYWARELQALGHEVRLIPPRGACPRARPEGEAFCEDQQERRGGCGSDLQSAGASDDAICHRKERRAAIGLDAAPGTRVTGASENHADQCAQGPLR